MVSLTSRERAVLRRLAAGHTMPEIARAEFVSVNTIKTQVRAIYRKLEVAGRDAAIRRARDHGLL
jgi:LuxR family maltose regulon positive regulatory protein